jgi:hypothetical protein
LRTLSWSTSFLLLLRFFLRCSLLRELWKGAKRAGCCQPGVPSPPVNLAIQRRHLEGRESLVTCSPLVKAFLAFRNFPLSRGLLRCHRLRFVSPKREGRSERRRSGTFRRAARERRGESVSGAGFCPTCLSLATEKFVLEADSFRGRFGADTSVALCDVHRSEGESRTSTNPYSFQGRGQPDSI